VTENLIFDIAVIGGGVNGAGIARDATGRGAKILLLEQGDLARGTSSSSTKLIHGGLRYLEHYEFGLVREALKERETLWAIAPHIIWPMRFVLPHNKALRPKWLLRLGLFLYDHIGGRRKLPPAKSIDLTHHVAGKPLKPGYNSGFEYSDGWVDDARLVILNALDAAERGAEIHTRSKVTGLARVGGLWHIEVTGGSGEVNFFQARSVVNAAGPSVIKLLETAHIKPSKSMRLVSGSHIVVKRIFDHEYAYFLQLAGGRIFFAIPYNVDFTLIGTTDHDHHGSPDEVKASAEEISYLCEAANQYFTQQIKPSDVVWSFSGVRPLIDDGSGKPEAATRGYALETSPPSDGAPLLNVFGGKITSYRHLSQQAVDMLAKRCSFLSDQHWTAHSPLPGGDFAMEGAAELCVKYQQKHPFLEAAEAGRIVKAYGTRAATWLGNAQTKADLGVDFGHGLSASEVDYLIHQEWAQTADDILWRRSKLGLYFSAGQTECLKDYLAGRID
jgi:glycerol-3-phosphate dehydrogenase